jgi:hypothetical protein
MTVFRDVAPCSLIETDDVSEVFTASIIRVTITLMIKAVSISATSVYFHQTTRRNVPKILIFIQAAIRT